MKRVAILILIAFLVMGVNESTTELQEEKIEQIGAPPEFPEVPPADSSWYGTMEESAMNDTISEKGEFKEDIVHEEGVDSIWESMEKEDKIAIIFGVVVSVLTFLGIIISAS